MTCPPSVKVDTVNSHGDPAVLEADRAALREVAWVSHDALALAREGVGRQMTQGASSSSPGSAP